MSNAITVSNGQQEIKIYTVQNRGHAVYQLSYYQAAARQRRTFADLSDAKREAKVILGQLAVTTGQTERLSFSDMESYTIARQKLAPTGVPLHVAAELFAEVHTTLAGRSLIDAVRFFADAHPTRHAQTLLSDLIEPFAESRIAMGTHADYVADIKRQLGRLVQAFPAKSAPDLSAIELDKWMGALKSHAITKNNVRKILITFGNWCKLHGYLPNNRPTAFDGMITYKVPPTKIGIYTPAELSLMLHTVADAKPDLLPWAVCAAFTGARVSELAKLEWQHLNFERSFIEVASLKVRTKARRLVPMCDAMKAWLLPHRQKSGPINLYVAPHAALARVLAQNTQPPLALCDNGFRHSYISYRIAAIHDTARVALEAGNSADVIFQHYRELVSSEDATAWFCTVPISAAALSNVVPLAAAA
jgi:integrase